ncbi:MAG TPA: tryptophan synthase subunit alpha [Firmicutes bacterium]|nr:tryptophan synthase subunit alpha [Bacillota bacterium]
MSRVASLFAMLGSRGEKALIGYLTVGDPDRDESLARCREVLRAGADALELGVPYSDPLADGPVIQAAGQRALAAGFRLEWLWSTVETLRSEFPGVPLAVMTYVNPVLQFGLDRFVQRARDNGADALILPDLPPEESTPVRSLCQAAGLDLIPFVAPTTPLERMQAILPGHTGFVYCVSVTGVTGTRIDGGGEGKTEIEIARLLCTARATSGLPACLGFGIATPGDVRRLAGEADGVIVGSALVRARTRPELARRVADLKAATLPVRAEGRADGMVK